MTNSPGDRSVDHMETETDMDTERTPLLAGTPSSVTVADSDDATDNGLADDAAAEPLADPRALLRPRVILLSLVLVFLLELAIGISVPPSNAIMESIICRQMHPDVFVPAPPSVNSSTSPAAPAKSTVFAGGIVLADDPACKAPDVQGYLAMLRGWQNTFECIPGIVGAVPYGMLSDRWGRKPVLGLSVFGVVLMMGFPYIVYFFSDVMPLWTVWFSAVFGLIGGGGTVLVAMLYTAAADVVPPSGRATIFFQLGAVFLGSQMVAGPIGGAMLIRGPWLPLLVAWAIMVIANLTVLAFPETVHIHGRKGLEGSRDAAGASFPMATRLLRNARTGVIEAWDFVLSNKTLAFLTVSHVFTILGRYVGELLLQYATDRYHWSWSFASVVLTIRNAGSLVTLLALLPAVSWLCIQRFGMASVAKDLWLARWSGIILIAGSLIIAAAANGLVFSFGLAWLALGSGITALVRSLLNTLVEEHHVGTVNSLIGFSEQVGMTLAGPLLAKSLSVGLNLGGAWIGLPFFGASLLFAISTTILWIFRLPELRRSSAEP